MYIYIYIYIYVYVYGYVYVYIYVYVCIYIYIYILYTHTRPLRDSQTLAQAIQVSYRISEPYTARKIEGDGLNFRFGFGLWADISGHWFRVGFRFGPSGLFSRLSAQPLAVPGVGLSKIAAAKLRAAQQTIERHGVGSAPCLFRRGLEQRCKRHGASSASQAQAQCNMA